MDRPFYTGKPSPWLFVMGDLGSRNDIEGTDDIERSSAPVRNRSEKRRTDVEKFLAAWSANGDLCVEDMFTRAIFS